MTAATVLLPGDQVLIDSRCCSRCARNLFDRGDRGTVQTVLPSGEVYVTVDRTGKTVLFSAGQLLTARRALGQAGHASTAVVLAVCLFGSLLFLALVAGGRHVMCDLHHNGLSYCTGYQAARR